MSIALVSLDHRDLSRPVLDDMGLGSWVADAVLERLSKSAHIAEVVVLSTCMRTEIYVDAVRFHGAIADIRHALAETTGVGQERFAGVLLDLHDESAFEHLFKVASGLKSPVIGESEVLGQVARAWAHACERKTCRSVLSPLFRAAVEVGKRARSETAIGRGPTSIAQAAVTMAAARTEGLKNKRVLVIGAGEMSEGMAAAAASLRKRGGTVLIANRTAERAEQLAERVSGTAVPFTGLTEALCDVDVVLSSTGSPAALLHAGSIAPIMSARPERPLVLVDMAVPRDIDPAVEALPGVTLLDLDDLTSFVQSSQLSRRHEVDSVNTLVEEAVTLYLAEANGRSVAPLVRALRDRAEALRLEELERHRKALMSLSPEQREAVEAVTKSTLAKLLHDPTVRLKSAAGTPEGERMTETLRSLFGL